MLAVTMCSFRPGRAKDSQAISVPTAPGGWGLWSRPPFPFITGFYKPTIGGGGGPFDDCEDDRDTCWSALLGNETVATRG